MYRVFPTRSRVAAGALLVAIGASGALAQQPDSTRPRTRADSVRADSIARARADSIALQRELERALATPASAAAGAGTGVTRVGPSNPRLLPDISAVGDFVGDLTSGGSTQEDGSRLGVREVEVAIQAVVDPYFRGDIFLGLNDVEKVSIEQAYLTATALPGIELRLGRYLLPVGKQNTTHRHDLHTVEYPWVLQRFFGPEGLKGTGAYVSRVFAPFGWYQEVLVTVSDHLGETPDSLVPLEPVNRSLNGLAYTARLRNYFDLSQSANVEISASAVTGKVARPAEFFVVCAACGTGGTLPSESTNATGGRQSVAGIDLTYRWRPLQQGLYRSFIFQTEIMRQWNAATPAAFACDVSSGGLCSPVGNGSPHNYTGGYAYARWQLTQRAYVGARYDHMQDPLDPDGLGRTLHAGSGYLEWFPSEFSKLVASYERYAPGGGPSLNRVLLQATFALGPHKPHPF